MKRNPDKWIRKAFYDLITDKNISSVWDMNVTGGIYPNEYVLLSTQTKLDNQITKCGGQWDCTILLDIVTRYIGTGNTGSRLRVNDIEEDILMNIDELDIQGGFGVFRIELESSNSLDSSDKEENIYRQLMRYRIVLNELETT